MISSSSSSPFNPQPPTPDSQPPISNLQSPDFWEGRYQEGTARWDLGQPAPPFVSLLESHNAPCPGRMAVLGSGNGHDALFFADRGFEVVGFDFAPSAIATATAATQHRGLAAQFLQRDIFALEDEFTGQFDYVLEHTCYCAIEPRQRPAYVQIVKSLLRAQGELIALFWAHGRSGGPPFGTRPTEILAQFSPNFEVLAFDPVQNSIEGRKNEEYLARFRRKEEG